MEFKSSNFYLTLFLIITLLMKDITCNPIVQIGRTKIVGENCQFMGQHLNQYLSIPYAEPPTGQLRFQKTVPLKGYPEVMHAVHVPPACWQYTEYPLPWYVNTTHKSEDCLFLNIWTPADASPQNRKAVMYWIHGGGYRYGSIQDKLYSGVALAVLGDIVLVTVNFRLGPFGFLSSGTNDARGNAGLWDILEGLKWVNKNIVNFGGDPTRITIAGESTGAMIVGVFSASPLTKGLFRRQILQSGAAMQIRTADNARNLMFSQQIAKIVGCADDSMTIENNPKFVVECLKGVDPATLSKADFPIDPSGSIALLPICGDEFFPKDPSEVIFHQEFPCTEILIGNTKEEGTFKVTTLDPEFYGLFGEKNPFFTKREGQERIRSIFQDFLNFTDFASVISHYLPYNFPEDDYPGIRRQVYTSLGDYFFLCPEVYHAEKCAENGGKVYFYWWAHRSSTSPWVQWMGVVHFTELEFIFGQPLLNPADYEPEELEISVQMIDIWSSFIKDGKPSIAWPLYSRGKPCFKHLGPGIITGEIGVGPHKRNCDFFRPYFIP